MENKKLPALLRAKEPVEDLKESVESPDLPENNQTATKVEGSALLEQINSIVSAIPLLEKSVEQLEKKVDNNKKNLATKIEYVDVNRKIDDLQNKEKIVTIEKHIETIEKIIYKPSDTQQVVREIPGKLESVDEVRTSGKKLPSFVRAEGEPKVNKDQKVFDVLNKILSFLQKSREEDKLAREKERNFEYERKEELDRKNQEFLDAISSLTATKVGKKKTKAEKEEDGGGGFFGKLFSGLATLLSSIRALTTIVSTLIGTVTKFVGRLGSLIMSAVSKLFGGAKEIIKLLPQIARFFLMNPIGIGLLAGATLLGLLTNDKNPEATTKAMQGAGSPDLAAAQEQIKQSEVNIENAITRKEQNLLFNRPSEKKSSLPWKDSKLQKEYLKEIGWDPSTGTTKAERDKGVERIDEDGNLVYKKQTQTETPTTAPVENQSAAETARLTGQAKQAEEVKNSPKETPGQTGSTTETMEPLVMTPKSSEEMSEPLTTEQQSNIDIDSFDKMLPSIATQDIPKALPELPENLSTRMASATKENTEMKLMDNLGDAVSQTIKNISTTTQSGQGSPIIKIPAVRNQDDSLSRAFYNSTRLV